MLNLLLLAALAAPVRYPVPNQKEIVTTSASLAATAIDPTCDASIHTVEAPACAYLEIPMGGHTKVTIGVSYVYDAATAVDVWIDGSLTGSAPWFSESVGDGSTYPTVTMSEQKLRWAVSADDAWQFTIDNISTPWLRLRVVGASATADDTVALYVIKVGD